MRRNVLAVSGSPALDRVILAPRSASGGTVRATTVLDTPGGKAIHVAIVAGLLGSSAHVVVPLGGPRGAHVRELLDDEPLVLHAIAIAAETRRTTTVVDPEAGDVLEVLETSAPLSPEEADELVEVARRQASVASVVVVSGSAPPGADDLPARLAAAARDAGAFVVLDTSGSALAAGLATADVVSPNVEEACALIGVPVPTDQDATALEEIARGLLERGARTVWLSAGARGSTLATGAKTVHLAAPGPLRRVNAVGCGDALLGGFAAGVAEGLGVVEAAVLGVAAATAKLGELHPARLDPVAARALQSMIAVTPARAAISGMAR